MFYLYNFLLPCIIIFFGLNKAYLSQSKLEEGSTRSAQPWTVWTEG